MFPIPKLQDFLQSMGCTVETCQTPEYILYTLIFRCWSVVIVYINETWAWAELFRTSAVSWVTARLEVAMLVSIIFCNHCTVMTKSTIVTWEPQNTQELTFPMLSVPPGQWIPLSLNDDGEDHDRDDVTKILFLWKTLSFDYQSRGSSCFRSDQVLLFIIFLYQNCCCSSFNQYFWSTCKYSGKSGLAATGPDVATAPATKWGYFNLVAILLFFW